MIHEKFIISDTHFFHANTIYKFKRADGTPLRDFTNQEAMHETMIKGWNDVVGPNDYVYHLGDVSFEYGGKLSSVMSQLKGRKRLILGNHDKIKGTNLLNWFEKVELWKGFKEYDFTMSHIPLMLSSLRDGAFNVHGHTHYNLMSDPHYINVCVERTNYAPVSFDYILQQIKDAKYLLTNK